MELFKKPLSLNEQIEHLNTQKNINFYGLDDRFVKNCLLKYNYINLITPFKHYYALKNINHELIKDEYGNHLYPNIIEFNEYVIRYTNERKHYATIYRNISDFEVNFNSIISHYCITTYKINSIITFNIFINSLKLNLMKFNSKIKLRNQIYKTITDFESNLYEYNNLYILFDRLSLNDLCNIFRVLDDKLKNNIFSKLLEFKKTFNFTDLKTFEEKLHIIVGIRNCVYHNNSLEILIRFYNFKNYDLRKSSDQRSYRNIIEKLVK